MKSLYVAGLLLFSIVSSAVAQPQFSAAASAPILPPLIPWNGKSRELVVPQNDPWITPAEKSDLRTSPSYDETMGWLRNLVAAAPQLKMVSLGKSSDGRDIWMVIASQQKQFTPDALRKGGKPIVFAQAGIHAGEIDGKDAGMMLLRDMTVRGTKRDLLDGANFLFVPIFNVDGHERKSRSSRPNQRGPEVMGWRTTSRNLNLNRDYAKADAPEMKAMIRALNDWQPHLYIDLHVTDGADYQYDVTFGYNRHGHSPEISGWLEATLNPALTADLAGAGHIPGPLAAPNWKDPMDWRKGIKDWEADPRFSNGYGDARHLPTLLVENHSLKPFDQRVLGTYVLLESAVRTVAKDRAELRRSIQGDQERQREGVAYSWGPMTVHEASIEMEYKGIETRIVDSPISGTPRLEYTGTPAAASVNRELSARVTGELGLPKAYWIPTAWSDVIDRLQLHGIRVERLTAPRDVSVTMYRLEEAKFETEAFEGRVRVTAKPIPEKRTEHFPAGSIRVPTDQPLGTLAALLCEPVSPDSFFQWGFFNEVLQQTEYIEPYVIDPMAERMMAEDPALADEFQKKLASDAAFRDSPEQRRRWFYMRTPFADERWKLFPIAREE